MRRKISRLYIPHGSDERTMIFHIKAWPCLLYIPHGSDESRREGNNEKKADSFISHMVQMKVENF